VGVAIFADFAGQTALDSLRVGADSLVVLYARGFDVESNDTGPVLAQWSLGAPPEVVGPPVADGPSSIRGSRAGRLAAGERARARRHSSRSVPERSRRRHRHESGGPALGDTTLAAGIRRPLRRAPMPTATRFGAARCDVDDERTGATLAAFGSKTILRALRPAACASAAAGSVQASTGIVTLVPGPLARCGSRGCLMRGWRRGARRSMPTRCSNFRDQPDALGNFLGLARILVEQ
jgi:hypothetical protein